jgi:hydrogenase maturation factor
MNLLYGEVLEVFTESGIRMGKIQVGGAAKNIPLELLTDAVRGDRVLICDGVAIGKVAGPNHEEINNVPGDSGETY